jgi:ligand-binding sensor domain-containing protein/signal transduction histidine kinase
MERESHATTLIRGGAIALGLLLLFCRQISALSPSLAISQYAHTVWTVKDGNFRGVIYTITQGPEGFLWLGTEFGIVRFDGVRFEPWYPPAGQSLPSNYVRCLLFSRDWRLWIGTANGLVNFKDGKLTTHPQLSGQAVFSLLEDRDGTVWAGGVALAGKLCALRGTDVRCFGEDGMFGSGIVSLHEDRAGSLWVGSMTGLWKWKPGLPQRWTLQGSAAQIQSIVEAANGTLWIGFYGGITEITSGRSEAYRAPAKWQIDPTAMVRDRDGAVWIGTRDHGLIHARPDGTDLFAKSDGLSSDLVSTMFEDREGNMWVATLDALHRFRDFAVPSITSKQGLSADLLGTVVRGSEGSIWLGTLHGTDRWKNGRVTVYSNPTLPDTGAKPGALFENRSSGISPTRDRGVTGPAGLPAGMVTPLFCDAKNRIWFSTPQGLLRFEDGRMIDLGGEPWGHVVISIVADRDGSTWINDQNRGLTHLNADGAVIEQLSWAKLGHQDWALTVASDPVRNGIWIGFRNGGLAFLADGKIRTTYTATDGLGSGRVNALQFDQEGALWAAAERGLSRLKDGHIGTLSTNNGLPCDDTDWVAEDDDRSLWFLASCGIIHISSSELAAWTARIGSEQDTGKVEVALFDSADGVISHSRPGGHSPRLIKAPDGKFWFLPLDGVSILDPKHLAQNPLPPPVKIEQITANHEVYWRDTGPGGVANLRLRPNVRELEIDYTALSLVAPEKVRFRYRLEGSHQDWQDVGTRRQAYFENLPPGKYRFRLVACNNSGVWNESGAFLDFSIAPTFYQNTWFLASAVIAFIGFLWMFYIYRLRRVAEGFNIRLAERVDERTRIARELHDTLLQGLHSLLFHFQAVNNLLPSRPDEAKWTLERALDSAAQSITEARDAVYDLRSHAIDNDFATAIRALGDELAQHHRTTDGARCSSPRFSVIEAGTRRDLQPVERDELYRIVAEALRNAFRHASAEMVEVKIDYGKDYFVVQVRDNGCGFDQCISRSSFGRHWGLTGMYERAKNVLGVLNVHSQLGVGTELELRIPAQVVYQANPQSGSRGLHRKVLR